MFCCPGQSATAAFSSIYVFGDSLSDTSTNNATGSTTNLYYGKRYCNGRVWVELLAQRQGLGANSMTNINWAYSSNNVSFYGQYSPNLVTNVNKFTAPANGTNCLFIVWVCNADFVGDISDNPPPAGTNLITWTTAINLHLTNHFKIITNLYAKGCRVLVAPNAADVTSIPEFNGLENTNYNNFVRQRISAFNSNYVAMLHQIVTNSSYPNLTIYVPDVFTLVNNVLTNAAAYGLTNALSNQGNGLQPIDVLETPSLSPWALNGPGTNYIFWDDLGNPTAKFHELIADTVQQMLSPAVLAGITPVNGSNRIDAVNLPVGMNGTILYATNVSQITWLTNSTFSATNLTQSLFVNPTNSARFYSLKFPWQWTWP
ncbi:MAG TPA: SGNH/GDSL hydrolase family protein [Candidatus Sulfotelmatobacter sp.]|nr:SGNH/GDSL hydrolase family protein [Candidatus Sulfotelmatobacter sp.]